MFVLLFMSKYYEFVCCLESVYVFMVVLFYWFVLVFKDIVNVLILSLVYGLVFILILVVIMYFVY